MDDAEPLARALLAAARASEAAEVAAIHARMHPESYDAWELVAATRTADGDAVGAQKAWLEAVRRAPSRPEPYRAILQILLSRGDLDRAERLVQRGIELAGQDPELLRLRESVQLARSSLPPGAPTSRASTPPPGAADSMFPPAPEGESAVVPMPSAPRVPDVVEALPAAPAPKSAPALASSKSAPPASVPPKTPAPGAAIRPRAVIFQPSPPPSSSPPARTALPLDEGSTASGTSPGFEPAATVESTTSPTSEAPARESSSDAPSASTSPGFAKAVTAGVPSAPTPTASSSAPPRVASATPSTQQKTPAPGAAIRPRAMIYTPPPAAAPILASQKRSSTPPPAAPPQSESKPIIKPAAPIAKPTPAPAASSGPAVTADKPSVEPPPHAIIQPSSAAPPAARPPSARPVPVAPPPSAIVQASSSAPASSALDAASRRAAFTQDEPTTVQPIINLAGAVRSEPPAAAPPFAAQSAQRVSETPSGESRLLRPSGPPLRGPAHAPRPSAPPPLPPPDPDDVEIGIDEIHGLEVPTPRFSEKHEAELRSVAQQLDGPPKPFFPRDASDEDAAARRAFTDAESTKVTHLDEIAALRELGARLPDAPPTPHRGSTWEPDEPPSDPDVATSVPDPSDAQPLVLSRPPQKRAREREDATVPYSRAEVSAIADRLIPLVNSTPPDEPSKLGGHAEARPSDLERATVASPRTRGKRAIVGFAIVGVLGLGVGGLSLRNRRVGRDRLDRLEAGLLEAAPHASRDALDAAALTNVTSGPLHRDLRLEATLVRALDAGGVSADSIRAASVAARARGVDASWAPLAAVAEALANGDRALAERSMPTGAVTDPRAGLVRGRAELAVGRVEPARVAFTQALRAAPHALALELALADVERASGDDAAATRRLDALARGPARHARLEAARASIALDAEAAPELARLTSVAGTLAGSTAAERALFDAVLGRARARRGDRGAATRLEALAGVRLAPHVALEVALLELELGNTEAARARLVSAFGEDPTDVRARRALAGALADLGLGARAAELIRGDDASDLSLRGRAALHGAPSDAREAATAIASLGTRATVALQALELRLRLRAGDDAASLLTRATDLKTANDHDRDALLAFVSCAVAAGRWELVGALDGELAADPAVAPFVARAAMRRGDLAALGALVDALRASHPNAPDTLVVQGFLESEKGETDAALATYDALGTATSSTLEGSPAIVAAAGRLAALTRAGRLADARAALAALPAATQEDALLGPAKAMLAVADGRAAEALPWLERNATGAGATPALLVVYGDALFSVGSVDAALASYRQALEIDAGNPEAQLGIALVFFRASRFDDAGAQLIRARRALDARPHPSSVEGRYFTLLGRNLIAKDDLEQARFVLRRAVQQAGAPAEAYFFLGESLAGSNTPDASEAYRQYLNLAPQGQFASRASRAIR